MSTGVLETGMGENEMHHFLEKTVLGEENLSTGEEKKAQGEETRAQEEMPRHRERRK
jgi:hypothetical protein